MNILTWEPDKRDEVMKRAQITGMEHEGIKVLGTWADVQGGRAFQLTDVPAESTASIKANFDWNDIMGIESVAVMKAEDLLKLVASMK